MTKPKFSIIIPAYNSSEYIGNALGSVRSQVFENYELAAKMLPVMQGMLEEIDT